MISTWALKHFKSANAQTDLELAPLTIFAGANSSGKSTIIQSLLLTAQTLQSPVHSRPVVLNGHIQRLGAFDDVVSHNSSSQSISIGFKLIPDEKETKIAISSMAGTYFAPHYLFRMGDGIEAVECYFEFSSRGPTQHRDVLQLQPCLEECRIKSYYKLDDVIKDDEVLIRRSTTDIKERLIALQLDSDKLSSAELSSLEYEICKPATIERVRYYGLSPTGILAGATLLHFLPGTIGIVFDAAEERARQLVEQLTLREEYRYRGRELNVEKLLNERLKNELLDVFGECIRDLENNTEYTLNAGPRRLLGKVNTDLEALRDNFSLKDLREFIKRLGPLRSHFQSRLAESSSELQKIARGDSPPEYTLNYGPLPDFSEAAVAYIQYFFSRQVKYLGPLRDEPKPVYPLAGATDPRDVGFRGEHTAAVLDVHRNTQVEYIPSKNFLHGKLSPAPSTVPLTTAVLDWLSYMGIADNIITRDRGKLGHELRVTTVGENAPRDLTHVGVGVSQVLPILVLSLLAEPGSTLIFEQPELHLHPRVQTRLADFFISMTMIRKQSIVETHSEYLINRLRYQTAVSDGDQLSRNIIMYFVEKDKDNSTYRSIKINQFGVIEDWPRGFFDENEENAASVLKAGMEKRKREIKKKDV